VKDKDKELEVETPTIELKGTYIKTIDPNKEVFYANSNFMILISKNVIPSNRFGIDKPSLITISYDPERYE